MSFKSITQIAGSAMNAQTVRLNTVASNMANANTSGTQDSAYRARKPVFAAIQDGVGARVQVLDVIASTDALHQKYEPSNPHANEAGEVFYSNVDVIEEMTDMLSASKAFATNVEVLARVNTMQQELLKLGGN